MSEGSQSVHISCFAPAYAAPSFKAVLPPIRGTYGAAEPERKQPFHEDEAGKLMIQIQITEDCCISATEQKLQGIRRPFGKGELSSLPQTRQSF